MGGYTSDIIVLVVVTVIVLALAGILLSGHGAFLIAGYNTSSADEKRKYNEKALCRFTGILLIVAVILADTFCIASITGIIWLKWGAAIAVAVAVIFSLVYMNVSKRFKKH